MRGHVILHVKNNAVFHHLTALQEDLWENGSGTEVLHIKVPFYMSTLTQILSFSRLYAHEVHLKEAVFHQK